MKDSFEYREIRFQGFGMQKEALGCQPISVTEYLYTSNRFEL